MTCAAARPGRPVPRGVRSSRSCSAVARGGPRPARVRRRPGRASCARRSPTARRPGEPRRDHQQGDHLLPRRRGRRHRLPDAAVQHRHRRAVPAGGVPRGGRRRRRRAAGTAPRRARWSSSPWSSAPAWAAIAGALKAYRGVSEVISTIMLNGIATGIIAFLLNTERLGRPRGRQQQRHDRADPRLRARCRGSRRTRGDGLRLPARRDRRRASATGSSSTGPCSGSSCGRAAARCARRR